MVTRKRLRSSAALTAVLLLSAFPAFGAAITFAPAGTQLDGDPILDIVPGGQITFDVSINTAGLGGNLTAITYSILYDQTELSPTRNALDVGGVFTLDAASLPTDPANPGMGLIRHGGGNLAPGFNAVVDRLTFDTLVLVNNGSSDFLPRATSAFANIGGVSRDVTAQFTPIQFVEVQPVPEPSSLALFATGGLALLWQVWRRRRRIVPPASATV
jgi:hypothetical protein